MKTSKKSLPVFCLSLLVVIFFNRLFFPKPSLIYTPDFGSSDVFHFNYSLKELLSQSLKNNQLPLWTDKINSGFPILAEGQIGTFNIFNLLFFKFLPTWMAFNLSIIVIFLTLIIGQYLFLTSLKLSKLPAVMGAISFSLSAYFITKITHFNHIQTASFIPFILFFLEKYLKKQQVKYLVFISFFLAQQVFSGYPMMVLITFILIFYRLFAYFFEKKLKSIKAIQFLTSISLTIIISLGLAAIQLFPQIEYLKLSNLKSGFPFKDITQYHYSLKSLLRFLHPFSIGNPTIGTYSVEHHGIFWENSSFFGIIPLLLSFSSLFLLRKKVVKYFLSLTAVGLLLAFGRHSPIYFIFTIFPFNLFRVPSRYLLITIFSLSSLAAICLEAIKVKLKNKTRHLKARFPWSKDKAFNFLSLVFIAFTFFQLNHFFTSYHLLVDKDAVIEKPAMVESLEKNGVKKIYSYGGSIQWFDYFKKNWQDKNMFLFLKNHLSPNSNLIWKIPSQNSYFTQYPLRSVFFEAAILKNNSNISEKGLQIAGVSHLIIPNSTSNKNLSELQRFEFNNEEIYLYKVNKTNQKFWMAKSYQPAIKTVEEAKRLINQDGFDYEKTVLLEKNLNLPLKMNNNPIIEIIQDTDQEKQIRIKQNEGSSLLIINQSFYPGWQAFIDGGKKEIIAANLNQQAVIIPPGNHQVRLSFKPNSFILGKQISITCLLILTVLFALSANKNPKTHRLFGCR